MLHRIVHLPLILQPCRFIHTPLARKPIFTTPNFLLAPPYLVTSKACQWPPSRPGAWEKPRQNTPNSCSTSVDPLGRTYHSSGSSQPNLSHTASHVHGTAPSSRPRPTSAGASPEQNSAAWQRSTPTVPDSLWFASEFTLGAGMIIIQPSTGKVVVISERQEHEDGRALRSWFLPRGRKDVGESLEQAALREAYEEVL